nr:hypothetical protein FFPRI1PSEUD_35290 [Pseudomonas sp. FFPRI_1]
MKHRFDRKVAPIIAAMSATLALAVQAADFTLSSPEFKADSALTAAQYGNAFGCTGAGISPALAWANAPAGTRSFAVTYYDKDAPTGSGFWHWVVYDIPAATSRIEAGKIPPGAVEHNTDVGKPGYVGACPPPGREHNYVYTVHALNSDKLDIPPDATAAYARFVIYANTLAKATLPVTAGPRP